MENAEFKKCSKCKEVKAFSKFHKESRRIDGITCACKICNNILKRKVAIKHREKCNIKAKEWRKNNPEKNRARKLAYHHKKYRVCPIYRLKMRIKGRMYGVINGFCSSRTEELLGCTPKEYKEYLENKFWKDMTWENQGVNGWHIDHIIPLASFDLTNEEELKKAFHYTNTQPLWASDNLKKKDKLNYKVVENA